MSKMTEKELEKEEFYKVPKWIIRVKGLLPADILIYMLAYNNWRLSASNGKVDSDGSVYFYLTHESLKNILELGKNQIIASIKRLSTCGAFIREKQSGQATKYYLEGDLNNINFDITSLKKGSTQNKTRVVTKNRLDQSEKSDQYQSEKGDINKNIYNKNNTIRNNTIRIEDELEKENISQQLKNKILEFIAYRKEIKKPLKTYRSIKAMLNQIGKDFIDEQHLIESIDASIAKGYQGVFPTKIHNYKNANTHTAGQESYIDKWLRENGGAR